MSGMGAGLCQIMISVTVAYLSWQGRSDIAERGGVRDGGWAVSDRGQCQTCCGRGGLTLPREVVSGMGGGLCQIVVSVRLVVAGVV